MDPWMTRQGARVVGHRATVARDAARLLVSCTCGYESLPSREEGHASLMLALHLQTSVRQGAAVAYDDDGLSGVREPRRPIAPTGYLGAELELG